MPCRFLHHPYGLSSVCIERSTLANTKENVVASSFSSPEPRVNSSCSERFSSSRSSNFSYCTAFLTTGRRGEEVVCGEKYGGRTVVAWTLSNKISCGRCYRSFKRLCFASCSLNQANGTQGLTGANPWASMLRLLRKNPDSSGWGGERDRVGRMPLRDTVNPNELSLL